MKEKPKTNPVGELLRGLREERGLTLRQLADMTDTHFANLGNIERGRLGCGVKVASRIADGLGLSPNERQQLLDTAACHNKTRNARKRVASQIQNAFTRILQREGIDLADVASVTHEADEIDLRMKTGVRMNVEVSVHD